MLTRAGLRAVVGAAAVAALCGMALGMPAFANDAFGSVDCQQDPAAPGCVVQVDTPPELGGQVRQVAAACHDPVGRVVACRVDGVGWLADDGCYYRLASGNDLAAAIVLGGVPVPPGRWYVGACGFPPVVGLTKFRAFGVAPGPALLADQAVAGLRLAAPPVRINPPPAAGGAVVQIAFVPSWVWIDVAVWTARSATASVPGLSVTATATPTRLVLSTGDGGDVVCQGPGTAWTAGPDPLTASPTCGYTYTRQGSYTLTATVTWAVGWAGGGQTGSVPALTTVSRLPVQVVEPRALNTR